jgi:hypothetical protein
MAVKFKPAATNTGVVTVSDGRHKPMTLHKPDGSPLRAGDLVAGRVYAVNIETGEVQWPPKNRKMRREHE